jgi:hypothetical protein
MRRTPLVAGGFLAGALFGALPPVQVLPARWHCVADGGRWIAGARTCDYARGESPVEPGKTPPVGNPLHEEDR